MKKNVFICIVLFFCSLMGFSQTPVNEVLLTMLDGNEVTIALFNDTKAAHTYMINNEPEHGWIIYHWNTLTEQVEIQDHRKSENSYLKPDPFMKAKTPDEPGYFYKVYKANKDPRVDEICNAFRENSCVHGVGFIDLGDKIVRYVLKYKNNKLSYQQFPFFTLDNQDYIDFAIKDIQRQAKMDISIKSLFPSYHSEESSNNASKQKTWKPKPRFSIYIDSNGNYFKATQIVYSDGTTDLDFIIDDAGNYRRLDTIHGYPIVKDTIVPKATREAAENMFN